ncbi:hypothetical protein AYI68_g563 [Smittium mucronatum]|uniref:Uncharacterized protein n=1 Tax=Smittium mucronatum TaxID=133383 RepID=A0A1R0H7X1_9FUNG|nr:hypothetical protein AYI68_g563 [Smittium mucronatum]
MPSPSSGKGFQPLLLPTLEFDVNRNIFRSKKRKISATQQQEVVLNVIEDQISPFKAQDLNNSAIDIILLKQRSAKR